MSFVLIGKELREHRWAGVGVFGLAVAQFMVMLEFWLRTEPPTALITATNFTWGVAPLIAAYTARRLFVLEQEQSTIQLLRSLPVSPVVVTATKLLLGLVYNLGVNLAVLWTTAWVLQDQELIPGEWVARLSAQVAVYVFAWFALASFHAQLGAYRYAVWLVFLVALTSLDELVQDPTRTVLWTASLADDLETTRYSTPWDGVGLSLAWALGLTGATLALAQYRGGSLVDAWFTPMSGRRRSAVTGLAIIVLLGFKVATNATARSPGLSRPAARTGRIYTTDDELRPLARDVQGAAADLQRTYGLDALPSAYLRYRYDLRPEQVLTEIISTRGDGEVIVGIRRDAPPEALRRLVMTDLLAAHTAGHWERVPAAGAWAVGFAAYALADDSLASTAARLGPKDLSLLADFDGLRRRFGRRGAEAAGWLAWRAVAKHGGDPAVEALVQALFAERRSITSAGLAVARTFDPWSVLRTRGVDPTDVQAGLRADLEVLRQGFARAPTWSLPAVSLVHPSRQLPNLRWRDLGVDLAEYSVQLWWSVAGDLNPHPVPAGPWHVVDVEREAMDWPILVDPRRRLIATWVIDGEVQGWSEVERP